MKHLWSVAREWPIEELELGTRAYNMLKRAPFEVNTLGDFVRLDDEMLGIIEDHVGQRFGDKAIAQIKEQQHHIAVNCT